MEKETARNIRVGLMVTAGAALFIIGAYFIGTRQNLFGSTFRLTAYFHNVSGLMIGNNVRFAGIDVGTVEKVDIMTDSTVKVVMLIEDKARKFIKKNSLASIGTDGLMGNKLVNINSINAPSPLIEEGDILQTIRPIETDEMARTLNRTNEDVAVIVRNLRVITDKVNSPNTLWSILMDTVVAENVKQAIVNIKLTSNRTAIITGDLSNIISEVKEGKGTIGSLLTDTSLENKLRQTIVNIKVISDTLAYISGDLRTVSRKIKNGEGAIGTILMDTNFVHNLNQSMENIKKGSQGFDENMQALKRSVLLRKYFAKEKKPIEK